MSILGVDARKKIAELIKQIQEQSGGFGPPSAGYGDGKLYNGPEPVVGNAIKKVATFKPEIPFGTDIARKVVEGTENLGNQLVPPLELGPVKLTGSEQLDILLSGLLQKQRGEVEVPAAKSRKPELSPVLTTVPRRKAPVTKFDEKTGHWVDQNGVRKEFKPRGLPPSAEGQEAKLREYLNNGIITVKEYLTKTGQEVPWNIQELEEQQLQAVHLLMQSRESSQRIKEQFGIDSDFEEMTKGFKKPPTAPGTTVPDAVRRRLEAQGKIKPQPTVAPELTKSHIRDPYDDFLENYSTEPQINRAPEEAAKTAAQRERNASKMPQVYELEREFATHPDPEVRSDFAHVRENWLGTDDYLAQLKILQAEATPAYRAFAKRMEQEHWSNYNAPGPLAATNALEEARFKYVRGEIDLRTYEDMVDEARKLFDTPIPEPGPDPFNIEHDKLIEDHKSGKITDKQYFDSYLALKRKFKLA